MMSELAPISIYLVISPLVSFALYGFQAQLCLKHTSQTIGFDIR